MSNHDPNLRSGMASPASFLRLCLRPSRRLPSLRAVAAQQSARRRPLSTTQWRSAATDGAADDASSTSNSDTKEVRDEYDQVFGNPGQFLSTFLRDERISEEERALATRMLEDWDKVSPNMRTEIERLASDINEETATLRRPMIPKKDSFWNSDEPDQDLITDEVGEDDFEEDDMMAMGHAKLEEHREFREYARVAVWEMPLLSSKPAGACSSSLLPRRSGLTRASIQNLQSRSGRPHRTRSCASGTRHTWASSTPPTGRWWWNLLPATCLALPRRSS